MPKTVETMPERARATIASVVVLEALHGSAVKADLADRSMIGTNVPK
jgi:hypothetical protein